MPEAKTTIVKRSTRQHRPSDDLIEAAFAPKPISEANKYATLLHDCYFVPFQSMADTVFHECIIRKHPEDRNQAEVMRAERISNLSSALLPQGVNVILSQYDDMIVDGKECQILKCMIKIDHTAKAVLDKINAERLAKLAEISASR